MMAIAILSQSTKELKSIPDQEAYIEHAQLTMTTKNESEPTMEVP
jgi:hypothetical protein